MPRSEYKYNNWLQHLDPWDKAIPKVKQYNRQRFKEETTLAIEDEYDDIISYKHWAWGDIDSLYGDLGPAFYRIESDEFLREIGVID